jgi:hypothetical protein
MSSRSTFRGRHVHVPPAFADFVAVLSPFACLLGLAVLLSYLAPWS